MEFVDKINTVKPVSTGTLKKLESCINQTLTKVPM